MTDPVPLSGPVESREQPSDWYGFAAMFVQDHQIEPGGCTCGFCAWSVEHVAVSLAIQLQRMRDADLAAALATIRELRAEAEEANATFDVLRAEMKEASRDKRAAVEAADMIRDLWRDAQAERDRAAIQADDQARYDAAHPPLAAHLEAELAETENADG